MKALEDDTAIPKELVSDEEGSEKEMRAESSSEHEDDDESGAEVT